jgi:hypothetical protein
VVSDKSLYEKIRSIAETLLPGTTIYTFMIDSRGPEFNEYYPAGGESSRQKTCQRFRK